MNYCISIIPFQFICIVLTLIKRVTQISSSFNFVSNPINKLSVNSNRSFFMGLKPIFQGNYLNKMTTQQIDWLPSLEDEARDFPFMQEMALEKIPRQPLSNIVEERGTQWLDQRKRLTLKARENGIMEYMKELNKKQTVINKSIQQISKTDLKAQSPNFKKMNHHLQAENARMVAKFEHLQDQVGEALLTKIVEALQQISKTENQLSHRVCQDINQADTQWQNTLDFARHPVQCPNSWLPPSSSRASSIRRKIVLRATTQRASLKSQDENTA